MVAKLMLEIAAPTRTGVEMASPFNAAASSHIGIAQLSAMFAEIDAGLMPAVVRFSIDDSVGVAASQTVAFSFSNLIAGDAFIIVGPTGQSYTYTGQTGAVTLGDPTFQIVTSDTATGASVAAQVNADPRLSGIMTANNSTGTVTFTMLAKGSVGNTWKVFKRVTTAGAMTVGGLAFAGGKDGGQLQSLTLTLSGVIANNETLTIGSIVLTGKSAAPSGESQFLCNVSAAADGAALVACINAHSKLKGLVAASGGATVTMTYQEGGRVGALVTISKVITNGTLSAASFAPSTTDTWAASVIQYAIGATAT